MGKLGADRLGVPLDGGQMRIALARSIPNEYLPLVIAPRHDAGFARVDLIRERVDSASVADPVSYVIRK